MNPFRPLVHALLPESLGRAASRAGTTCVTLAVCAAFLFPVSLRAGTEVASARWVTAGALLLGGFLFLLTRDRIGVFGTGVLALVAGAVAAPALWLLLVAGGACLYGATGFLWAPHARRLTLAQELRRSERAAIRLAMGGAALAAMPDAQAYDDAEPPATPTQEVLESIGIALVLALVVREFGFEAFKIPTGSMEPTIRGDRPPFKDFFFFKNVANGDRLLAFKPAEFRRWDIVVFRYPLYRNTNYIKRLIGLPGERLEIRDGDIYVDGAIVPKPDDVQEVLWRRDLQGRPRLEIDGDDEWSHSVTAGTEARWTIGKGGADVATKAAAAGDGAPSPVAWAELRGGFANDLRLSFDLDTGGSTDGELLVSLEGGGREVEFRVSASGCEVKAPGGKLTAVPASLGPAARFGFAVADRVVRVSVDGRQVASWQHDDLSHGSATENHVRIGARGLDGKVRNLVVEEDTQYTSGGGLTTFDIPDDGYVMLGDNTTSSRDSRLWTARVITTKSGEEFVCPERARVDDDREVSVFRKLEDGTLEFRDSYGVMRRVPKAEIRSDRDDVPQPFVRRADLVGRAFLVFFPFPPAANFRPRFLR